MSTFKKFMQENTTIPLYEYNKSCEIDVIKLLWKNNVASIAFFMNIILKSNEVYKILIELRGKCHDIMDGGVSLLS